MNDIDKTSRFSPKEFLRARRPEKFSDSLIREVSALDRSMLEFHLETITNRSQEVRFEKFAKRLAEYEICPNLLPQTGPTGGGDSKVDSETYPVADNLTLGWFVGVGRNAGSERWAFAFSAKKRWKEKVRSDIQKIASTSRDYKKAFFISNQYIRDKERGDTEDELRENYNIDVRILDRTWILDKVFTNRREEIAIEELEISTAIRREIRKGPHDVEREIQLSDIERRIEDALQNNSYSSQLVEDCINSAILSRELELPRTDVEGKFQRAINLSIKYGSLRQQIESSYQLAWTIYWWYEDYANFVNNYETVEKLVTGSRNAYDYEQLTNLWFILHTLVKMRELDEHAIGYHEHTSTLILELERLSQERNRPSTALQALTLILLMRLSIEIGNQGDINQILEELQRVFHQTEGLVGYPLEPLVQILIELGDTIDGIISYEEIIETAIETTAKRQGEVSAARLLLRRGEQKFESDKPYEAIQLLGRAIHLFYKHETRNEAVKAMYLCGCSFERAGLLWAAHGTILNAASLATDEFWKYNEITPFQSICFRRLKWIELQLGRIPNILEWHRLDIAVRNQLAEKGVDEEKLFEGEMEFDLSLGILLLQTDFWELKRLSTLPDVLERLGLYAASTALKFALGYEDELHDENFQEVWGNESLSSIFMKWFQQPAKSELPDKPLLYSENKIELNSKILGCSILLQSENESPCIELSESVLAALESLLSTGIVENIVSSEPILSIEVKRSEFAKNPFEFTIQDLAGRPSFQISCSSINPHSMSLEEQRKIKETILEFVSNITAKIIIARDPELFINKLFQDELAFDRSINFTGSFVTLGNILGYDPKYRISDWVDPNATSYFPKRSKPWNADFILENEHEISSTTISHTMIESGEPPRELTNRSRVKHSEIQTISLIRNSLWDEANWFGTSFLISPDDSSPPVLAPLFKNKKPALEIFSQWRIELGNQDDNKLLRITIVRGIDHSMPHSYRVLIGINPNINLQTDTDLRYMVFLNRINTMEPNSSNNLEMFLKSFDFIGHYYLTPAIGEEIYSEPKIDWKYRLLKHELNVRDAWQIGRHDIDSGAIHEDDEPIIPPDQKDPPVIELIRWKRDQLENSSDN